MRTVLINGIAAEYTSVDDRGLHYGDGLFETIACTGARPLFIEQHLNRMESGARVLDIPFPDRQLIQDDIDCLLMDSINTHSVIKLILTRGRGERGYRYQTGQIPTRICMHSAVPGYVADWQRQGIAVRFCETMASVNPDLAGIKSLNRLENVLASSELDSAYQEGLMSDIDGNVIEGTMSNVFAVLDDELITPDLSRCGIKGVMREQIIDIAQHNSIRVETGNITRDELKNSQEIFVCNSVIGLCVVKQLEQQTFHTFTMSKFLNTALINRIEANAKTAV